VIIDRSPYELLADLFVSAVYQDMRGTRWSQEGKFSNWKADADDSLDPDNWVI
jgi:hypothetical protein